MSEAGALSGVWKGLKEHPYVAGIGVFVVGAIIIYVFAGSGSAAPAASATADSPAGAFANAEATQAQAAVALQAQQSQSATAAAQVNGAVQVAQLQSGVTLAAINQSGSIASQSLAAAETLGLANLSANRDVEELQLKYNSDINLGSIAAVQNLAQIQTNSTDYQSTLLYNYLGYQARLDAETQQANNYAQLGIEQAILNKVTNTVTQTVTVAPPAPAVGVGQSPLLTNDQAAQYISLYGQSSFGQGGN